MKSQRAYWPRWAAALRRHRMHELAASLLEAGSPLAMLGAQFLYFGRGFFRNEQLDDLAAMLEDETAMRDFAGLLTQETAE